MKNLNIFIFLFIFAFGIVYAQKAIDTQKAVDVAGDREPSKNSEQAEVQSLDKYIAYVAQKTGKTILYDETITGRKVYLSNVKATTPEEIFKIFQAVIEFHGFILETTGEKNWEVIKVKRNITGPWTSTPTLYNIKDLEAIQRDNAFVSMVIPLKYASSREVQITLRALRMVNPQSGNLAGIESSNTILVTDFAPNLKRIYDLIMQIDRPKPGEEAMECNFKVEGQTITIPAGEPGTEIIVSIHIQSNAVITVTNQEGHVLSHSDSNASNCSLALTQYIGKKSCLFQFEVQCLKSEKTCFDIKITKSTGGKEYKEIYLWNFGVDRYVAAGKKIAFSLLFQ